jgi:hypothetical protein
MTGFLSGLEGQAHRGVQVTIPLTQNRTNMRVTNKKEVSHIGQNECRSWFILKMYPNPMLALVFQLKNGDAKA